MGRPPMPRDDRGDIVRPAIRMNSDAERAAARVAELRAQRDAIPEQSGNEFDFPLHLIPDGWEYQWKRYSTAGLENAQYLAGLDQRGWKPVPASRHPDQMPLGNTGEAIIRKGMILMELPKVFSDEFRAGEKREADRILADKKESLGEARTDLEREGGKRANINTTYETRGPRDISTE
jgi:hypothetical protein